jgi:hypothetical protein
VKQQTVRRLSAATGADIPIQEVWQRSAVLKTTVIATRSRDSAAAKESSSLPVIILFCAIGLLLSLGVIILDQNIPGDWF